MLVVATLWCVLLPCNSCVLNTRLISSERSIDDQASRIGKSSAGLSLDFEDLSLQATGIFVIGFKQK